LALVKKKLATRALENREHDISETGSEAGRRDILSWACTCITFFIDTFIYLFIYSFSMLYLAKLSVSKKRRAMMNDGVIVNNILKMIQKKTVVAYLTLLLGIRLKSLRNATKKFIQDCPCSSRDLNHVPFEEKQKRYRLNIFLGAVSSVPMKRHDTS
jgi:hypothetical protein